MSIRYNKNEEILNSTSHAAGILLGIVIGIIFLIWCFRSGDGWASTAVILYLVGMLAEKMEGKGGVAKVRPCGYLLAYSGQLFADYADSLARTGLLGVGFVLFCMVVCNSWYDRQFPETEGA